MSGKCKKCKMNIQFWLKIMNGGDHFEDLGIDRRTTMKLNGSLRYGDVRMWNEFI
jgi:hypothetical protein